MTFEQQIAALKERHEALTMNLDLMSHQTEQHRQEIVQQDTKIEKIIGGMEKIIGGMEKLLHIAEMHQERLDQIDGGSA